MAIVWNRLLSLCWSFAIVVLAAGVAHAQRIQIPRNPVTKAFYQQSGSITGNPLANVPQLAQAPSTTLGPPRFDPYATDPNAASQPPSLIPQSNTSPGTGSTTPFWQTPSGAQGNMGQPTYPQPIYPDSQSPQTGVAPSYQVPGPAFVQQPPVLLPNGIGLPIWNLPEAEPGQHLRLFQDIRLTHTWVNGGNATDKLDTNDSELATTVNFPNFLFLSQPLEVSPGFIFHVWDGPNSGAGPPAFPTDLPARVYSSYLNFGWQPMVTPQFGADLDFSAGVYTDFDTTTWDSVRFQGTGLLVMGLTPTLAFKGGVTYLDRLDVKLLPAGGIVWRPNPHTRFDVSFPKPKLAQYLTTIGNTDVWWYLNGEYAAGGSWTVSRVGVGSDRRMDINEMRAGGGFEWTCQSGLRGFAEAAYVFDRELVFASGPISKLDLADTVMVRGGLIY